MKWDNLTMSQKQALMKIYVNNGVTNLDEIVNHYNRYAEGGPKEVTEPPTNTVMYSRTPRELVGNVVNTRPVPGLVTMTEVPRVGAGINMPITEAINNMIARRTANNTNVINTDSIVTRRPVSYVGMPTRINRFDEGGYTKESLEKRKATYKRYDPTGGTGIISQGLYMLTGGNQAKGEENEYWKAYLGLDNNVPKMNPKAKTSWDDKIEKEKLANKELPSDFYGTTPRMDLNIQAIADTLNTGNIYRNYDKYVKEHPDLPSKNQIKEIYETGKRVLGNPNTWQQVDGDRTAIKKQYDYTTNESNPLGMLANFGMMWDPEEKTIYIHDTYDFKNLGKLFVGDRPKEMKIRGKVNFNPKKGSKLLRNNMESYYDYPNPINF